MSDFAGQRNLGMIRIFAISGFVAEARGSLH